MELKNFTLRIDDRLVHGQVNVGWLQPLHIKRVFIVDDHVVTDELTCSLWQMSLPQGVELHVLSHEEFAEKLSSFDLNNSMVLVRSVKDCYELLSSCHLCFDCVNVGGLHFNSGAREIFPYLYLSKDDIRLFNEMRSEGVQFFLKLTYNSATVKMNGEFFGKIGKK